MAAMLRFLVADDHAVIRRGLREILADGWKTALVDEAGNGSEALQKGCNHHWDLIILDITMPGGSGLDVLRKLRASRPRVPVLMLSAHTAQYYVQASLAAGAAGYVAKDAAADELITAVRTALKGGKFVSPCLAAQPALGQAAQA